MLDHNGFLSVASQPWVYAARPFLGGFCCLSSAIFFTERSPIREEVEALPES